MPRHHNRNEEDETECDEDCDTGTFVEEFYDESSASSDDDDDSSSSSSSSSSSDEDEKKRNKKKAKKAKKANSKKDNKKATKSDKKKKLTPVEKYSPETGTVRTDSIKPSKSKTKALVGELVSRANEIHKALKDDFKYYHSTPLDKILICALLAYRTMEPDEFSSKLGIHSVVLSVKQNILHRVAAHLMRHKYPGVGDKVWEEVQSSVELAVSVGGTLFYLEDKRASSIAIAQYIYEQGKVDGKVDELYAKVFVKALSRPTNDGLLSADVVKSAPPAIVHSSKSAKSKKSKQSNRNCEPCSSKNEARSGKKVVASGSGFYG